MEPTAQGSPALPRVVGLLSLQWDTLPSLAATPQLRTAAARLNQTPHVHMWYWICSWFCFFLFSDALPTRTMAAIGYCTQAKARTQHL